MSSRQVLRHIWNDLIRSCDPIPAMVSEMNQLIDGVIAQGTFRKILMVGAGKAVVPMANASLDVLRQNCKIPVEGAIVTKYGHADLRQQVESHGIEVYEAAHPLPDEAGVFATKRMMSLLQENTANDVLVINFITGGGSSLTCVPHEGLQLGEVQNVVSGLLGCGATIDEMNTVRKHLTQYQGGGMARIAHASPIYSFIVSDVIGDPLTTIAGGPTCGDPSTIHDCINVLEKYQLSVPQNVWNFLKSPNAPETTKPDDPCLENCKNKIIISNRLALVAASTSAASLGYDPLIMTSTMQGEAQETAKYICNMIKETDRKSYIGGNFTKSRCFIFGGETTVTLSENAGLGGRNQELALTAAIELRGVEKLSLLAAGTDGQDGPCDAAGAFADGTLLARDEDLKAAQDHLKRHDSFHFFQQHPDHHFVIPPTGTNVMDICLVLDERASAEKDEGIIM